MSDLRTAPMASDGTVHGGVIQARCDEAAVRVQLGSRSSWCPVTVMLGWSVPSTCLVADRRTPSVVLLEPAPMVKVGDGSNPVETAAGRQRGPQAAGVIMLPPQAASPQA